MTDGKGGGKFGGSRKSGALGYMMKELEAKESLYRVGLECGNAGNVEKFRILGRLQACTTNYDTAPLMQVAFLSQISETCYQHAFDVY